MNNQKRKWSSARSMDYQITNNDKKLFKVVFAMYLLSIVFLLVLGFLVKNGIIK